MKLTVCRFKFVKLNSAEMTVQLGYIETQSTPADRFADLRPKQNTPISIYALNRQSTVF